MIRSLLKLSLLVILMVFISAKGPEFHADYIRGMSGGQTVMLLGGKSGGSGFFVKTPSGDVHILTNRHVCEIAENNSLKVITQESPQVFVQPVIAKYDDHDLCLVEGIPGFRGLSIAYDLDVGETIGIIGHPKLHPLTLSKGEYIGDRIIALVTSTNPEPGTCRGTVRVVPPQYLMFGIESICIEKFFSEQITAYSRGGSSGSPVINFYGNVVGVLFAGDRQDPFESYAVPLESIKHFLKDF